MFRTLARKLGINPLDRLLKKKPKTILLGWNRGLGDIPLGLYAIVYRIRSIVPDAKITFVTRSNLVDGFSLLEGVEVIEASHWKRGEPYDLKEFQGKYDLIIEKPSPTDWCAWQHGKITPTLSWNRSYDSLADRFRLSSEFTYIGVQVSAETNYGLWRNWPMERWEELFTLLSEKGNVKVLLFGFGDQPRFSHPNIVDLRGKTTLFELLSLIKNRCFGLVMPDSGISTITYYLNAQFPLRHVTLWGDPNHGLLKQNVASPNKELIHIPLIATERDLSKVTAEEVFSSLFPPKKIEPLKRVVWEEELTESDSMERVGCVILAGGQGSRLGFDGPKGLFPILGKTLFQRLCEKVPLEMPVAIMTSPLNHNQTVHYFDSYQNFGRKIHFFQQSTLPLLSERYEVLEEAPDGNGSLFQKLVESNFLELFDLESVTIIPVDNPLADPADPRLLARHKKAHNDVTIKCIERRPSESMGVLSDRLEVVEYLDLSAEQLASPLFRFAYTGQIVVSKKFIERATELSLPLHWVKKKGVWKRERFIFDAFKAAKRLEAVCYPRVKCYAPIKGFESLSLVTKALSEMEPAI